MKVRVRLNGTDTNPYERLGLQANPFPAIPKAEYGYANSVLREMDAQPFPTWEAMEAFLRRHQTTEEFIAVCKKEYRPGERVEFVVEWPSPDGSYD